MLLISEFSKEREYDKRDIVPLGVIGASAGIVGGNAGAHLGSRVGSSLAKNTLKSKLRWIRAGGIMGSLSGAAITGSLAGAAYRKANNIKIKQKQK